MTNVDTRQVQRDSMFLLARLRLEDGATDHQVRVRNLSAGGMMAEGALRVLRGTRLSVKLRNIEWVDGTVAWVQDNRFGIAFDYEIDPAQARAVPPQSDEPLTPRYLRTAVVGLNPDTGPLRKI